jgi:hypothetical protein
MGYTRPRKRIRSPAEILEFWEIGGESLPLQKATMALPVQHGQRVKQIAYTEFQSHRQSSALLTARWIASLVNSPEHE